MKSLNTPVKRYKEDGIHVIEIEQYRRDGSQLKLGHFLKVLPHGVFNKTMTGIGGTTLELDALRASIIVEPLNITAFSKAQKKSLIHQNTVHYFGTMQGVKKIRNIKQSLLTYLETCIKNQKHPKITCVNDQLVNLKSSIDESNIFRFTDFHLLLDEIDYMQESTSFRETMQDSIEIYFKHPKNKRTLLSATVSEFFDQRLNNEKRTVIKVRDYIKIKTTLINSISIVSDIVGHVKHLTSLSDEKIVIAHNHIEQINAIIKLLSEGSINTDEIAVLCGEGNSVHFGNMYHRLKDGILPRKVNFITAAYFNGYDIDESYHVLMSVDSRSMTLRLSGKTLYQIHGRSRPGVLSCCIFFHAGRVYEDTVTREQISESIEVLEPINRAYSSMLKSKNYFLRKNANAIKNLFLNGAKGFESIWSMKGNMIVFSFFKIDKLLEDQRIAKTLGSKVSFKYELNKYFNITEEVDSSATEELQEEHDSEMVLSLIDDLSTGDFNNPLYQSGISELLSKETEKRRKIILLVFLKVLAHVNLFRPQEVLNRMRDFVLNGESMRLLNLLKLHVDYHSHITASRDKRYPSLKGHFYKQEELTASELKGLISGIIENLIAVTESSDIVANKTVRLFTTPGKFEKVLLEVSVRKSRVTFKKVVSLDPFRILNLEDNPHLDLGFDFDYKSEKFKPMTQEELLGELVARLLGGK